MSVRVLFNGVVLIIPGAATKIDASQFQNILLSGIGTVGLIGEADGGPPHTTLVSTSPAAVKSIYKSGDLVEAAAIAAAPGNDPRVPAGASAIVTYKVNNSTQASYTHAATLQFLSRQYGVLTNNITVALADGGSSSRIATIQNLDDFGALVSEVSPALGGTGKFTVQYIGAAASATMTITASQLSTTTTGAVDDVTLRFVDYPNLSLLIQALNATGKYSAVSLVTNAISFDTTNLDAISAVDVKTSITSIYSRNFDISGWINQNSQIISCVLTKGQVSPVAVLLTTPLVGGTRGTSANSNWVDGFTALRGVRINQLVPLASKDATAAQGTFTFASILASLVAHCKFASSTVGRNEVQGWAGIEATKANLIAAANLQNSEHLVLVGQKALKQRTVDGAIVTMPEWATAVTLAGMRAGAPLGEPLTRKFIQAFGVTSDATWAENNADDVTSMTLNGVLIINNVLGKGFRVCKGITTFTKQDNDAYTEESIVQIWKAVAFDLRTALEDTFVGRPGTLQAVQGVPAVVARVCEQHRAIGSITDSLVNGVTTKAYRNITASLTADTLAVGVTISPTPGINFVLNTIVLVPAQIST